MAKSWYILQTYTGYEDKVEREIRSVMERKELSSDVISDIRVPKEEVTYTKDGKERTRKNKFLPGYIMLEMELPELEWKETCTKIRKIQGVTGFVGTKANERPRPISSDEAKNLLQKSGAIPADRSVRLKQIFDVGEKVKIIDGPFATFAGTVEEVNVEKDKLRVIVQIFGRDTPVDVGFAQVERA
ncbi:MAG: transcription termination/antitermination factor NusG [Treponema sp.]|nr:transcription termination/antitermination factor NusG [Treponema sp.]